MVNQHSISQPNPDYYVVGGTLKPSASCYLSRTADEELLESLKKGDYCYILTTRQMGKSSLVIRTAKKLEDFNIYSVYIDLSAIGKDVTIENWYLGQIRRIVKKICREFNYINWWQENASFSEVDRYVMFLSEVLIQRISHPIILFIDEIDYTLNLPYSDDFFAAIRSLFNQRADNDKLEKLTFVLLGVASPSDLIKGVDRTPFNIGKRIELNDFTWEEALPLSTGLAPDSEIANKMLKRIIYWTGGHPYITQKACYEVAKWAQNNSDISQPEKIVESIVQKTFFTEHGQHQDDNLNFVRDRFLRSLKSTELLNLYKLIRQGEEVLDDERNSTRSELKLIGIVKVDAFRKLQVRNRIYENIFNPSWVELNSRTEQVLNIIQGDNKLIVQGNANVVIKDVNQNIIFDNTLSYRETDYQRISILNKVRNFWIKGVLEKSLPYNNLIQVGLEYRLDAIHTPFEINLTNSEQLGEPIVSGTKIIDVWDNIGKGRTLLILGEPGSGKTTLLLELARELIVRAFEDINHPIPVIFSLYSWSHKKQTIADWIVNELQDKYQVTQKLAKTWVKKEQLIILLDGLDEILTIDKELCIQALNEFIQHYSQTEVLVCSRMEDYLSSSYRLKFQTAISLQPLSDKQIFSYLFGRELELFDDIFWLRKETKLQELIKSPLMLNMLISAYRDLSTSDLLRIDSLEKWPQHLFDAYVNRMLSRRRNVKFKYSKSKILHWLNWLAKIMFQESKTMFFIEDMQPTLLQNQAQKLMYHCGLALTGGLIFGLMGGIVFGLRSGLFTGLGGGLSFILLLGTAIKKIKPAIRIELFESKYITSNTASSLFASLLSISISLLVGVLPSLSISIFKSSSSVILFAVIALASLSYLLFTRQLLQRSRSNNTVQEFHTETNTIPNQGIQESASNAAILGLIVGLTIGVIGLIIDGLHGGLIGFTVGILSGLLNNAGVACIQHFWLRVILWSQGYIPWNYARFLDYATECVFLQKVGSGYIFIHRLLLEHFARME